MQAGFSPVPVLTAPYFEREVLGSEMLDRLGEAVFGATAPEGVLHATVSQRLRQEGERAVLRLDLPFAAKGDVSLKKVGLELVVRVGEAKRVIELPSALAGLRPVSAAFADEALTIAFEPAEDAVAAGA